MIALSSAKQLRRTGSRGDVEIYVHGARLALAGENLYETPEPRGQQPYLYLPLFAFLAVPLALIPFPAAVILWSALNAALAWWIVVAFFRAMTGRSFYSLPTRGRWIVGGFSILLTLRALLYHSDLGQANLAVMAVALVGLTRMSGSQGAGGPGSQGAGLGAGARSAKAAGLTAGAAIGLAATLKTIVLPLWIPFVAQLRLRVVLGIAGGVLLGALLPAVFVGFERNLSYISYWITDVIFSADDLRHTPYWPLSFNYSLAAQLYRFFGGVVSFEHDGRFYDLTIVRLPDEVLRIAGKLMPVVVGAIIALYAWLHRQRQEIVSLWGAVALAFCLAPAFSLLSHKHYFVMLLPAHLYVVWLWYGLDMRDRWFRGLVAASFVVAMLSTTLFDFVGALMSNLGGLIWGSALLAAAIIRAAGILRTEISTSKNAEVAEIAEGAERSS